MNFIRALLCGALIVSGALLADPLLAQTKDVFAFIPVGGRTLLARVVESHPPAAELQAILTGKLKKENDTYIFYAEEITLKCPTKYKDEVPDQVKE